MKCAKRKRQITETEPVYRLFINGVGSLADGLRYL